MSDLVPDRDAVRRDVRAWVQANWDPDLSLVDWRTRLVSAGWAAPSWPRRWFGRDLPPWADEVVAAELIEAGTPGLPIGTAIGLAAPTILAHGPDAVCGRFLGPILTGEETWCQLFSEPGAGSDLAGLTTRADLDGDEWVINGQKVWNTSAHHADLAMLVARTDWDQPKHKGLSYFVLPMHQAGVEARPLRQMNNHASFNEVFLTDARIPREFVVGQVGEGWRVALTTLAFERRFRAPCNGPDMPSPPAGRSTRPAEKRRRTSRPTSGTRNEPAASTWSPAGRKPWVNQRTRSCARRSPASCRCRSPAAPTRSSTTSWASALSVCLVSRRSMWIVPSVTCSETPEVEPGRPDGRRFGSGLPPGPRSRPRSCVRLPVAVLMARVSPGCGRP